MTNIPSMYMPQQKTISAIAKEVKNQLSGEGSGHDWWHIVRVWNMAKKIAKNEKVDINVVELAALLHDIADWKFHNGNEDVGPQKAKEIMEEHQVDSTTIKHVVNIITHLSFKGANVKNEIKSLEGKVVQDADRLDALGAIGIARTFAYGGFAHHILYDPTIKPVLHESKEAYFNAKNTSINHFYEKLLLLKDRMHTTTAKKIAQKRHAIMEEYLEKFYAEWQNTD